MRTGLDMFFSIYLTYLFGRCVDLFDGKVRFLLWVYLRFKNLCPFLSDPLEKRKGEREEKKEKEGKKGEGQCLCCYP